jgi:hypothetical protein
MSNGFSPKKVEYFAQRKNYTSGYSSADTAKTVQFLDEEVEIAALLAAFLRGNEVTAVAPSEESAVASVSKWKQNRGSLH